jgi:hypothetical protein
VIIQENNRTFKVATDLRSEIEGLKKKSRLDFKAATLGVDL